MRGAIEEVQRRRQALLRARALVVVLALALGSLSASAPAFGYSQRGHVFAFAFAGKGSSDGRLLHPSGLAVDEASGDVYVVDAGNDRVERFGPKGEFISAWGWGVADGAEKYEVCTSACRAGLAGEGVEQLDAPEAVAIDNSTSSGDPSRGDVYVLSDTAALNNVVEKFSASGEPLGQLTVRAGTWGALGGVAVDSSGRLWVSDLGVAPEEVLEFSDALSNSPLGGVKLALECLETRGLAVAAGGEAFYVSHQQGNVLGECPEAPASAKAPAVIAAVSGAGEVVRHALDYENSSGVAVDQASTEASPLGATARGDVYVDNASSVAAFQADGTVIQRFGSEALASGSGVAIDSANGDVYVADAKSAVIDVFAPEPAAPPSVDSVAFEDLSPTSTRLEARVDPHGVDTHAFFQVGTTDCRALPADCVDVPTAPGEDVGSGFGAQVVSVVAEGLSPGTRYFYRALATNADGEAEEERSFGSFTTLPAASGGLADGRAWELVSPAEKFGALIYPMGGTTENGGPASGVIEAAADGSSVTYAANAPFGEGVVGNRSLEATQLVSTRSSSGWSTRDIETPTEGAKGLQPGAAQEYRWFSPDLSAALAQPFGPYALTGNHMQEPSLVPGIGSEEHGLYVRHGSSCSASSPGCYEPLVTPEGDSSGAQFGGELEFEGAAADLRHVVFRSDVALSTSAPSAPGLYEWSAGKPASEALSLVSVLPGNKRAAPSEPAAQLGDFIPAGSATRGAVSADGSRVFWSAVTEEHEAEITRLYMRETTTGKTIVINAAKGVKEPSAEERAGEEVHFRLADQDGSRVFFTDTFPLTASSRLAPIEEGEEAPADLYVCELAAGSEGPECHLKDLTVDPGFDLGETADVVGTLPGASEDGSFVYFVANGVLSEEARAAGALQGHCARPSSKHAADPSATCNLYLERYDSEAGEWEAPRFIAVLSQEDQPDWGGAGSFSLGALTSRVSPNGRFLAFMSKQPLTGYDNVDQSPAAHGARDEEVFLYDSEAERLTCVSCNPAGVAPRGVFDHEASGEGKGLLVDRLGVWKETEGEEHGGARRAVDHWLAGSVPGWTAIEETTAFYQSRYLSDGGRVFFDSPDAIVAGAHNAKEDVYEFEPGGVGSCASGAGCVALISSGESAQESAFMDASENGDDVFLLTSAPLTSDDHDTSFDVYDAHVCSEASPCISPPPGAPAPCEALETCRPASGSVSVFSGPSGTATFSGPLSAPAPSSQKLPSKTTKPLGRAQKLAKALRACRAAHKHSKRKRKACEHSAHKKYAKKSSVHRRGSR
jgi:DNA-binding beta-propeller fold protein YncE